MKCTLCRLFRGIWEDAIAVMDGVSMCANHLDAAIEQAKKNTSLDPRLFRDPLETVAENEN